MKTKIGKKVYTVSRVLNDMAYNFEFTDKDGIIYLVDGYDVQEWSENNNFIWLSGGLQNAIQYAKEQTSQGHEFYWKVIN